MPVPIFGRAAGFLYLMTKYHFSAALSTVLLGRRRKG
jgi:hypothetical protein